jgi:hypothetical protein
VAGKFKNHNNLTLMGSDLNALLDYSDFNCHNRPCDIVADISDLAISYVYRFWQVLRQE